VIALTEGSSMKVLVTGTAGFIGFHLALRLLEDGHKVVGLDSINDYYDVNLKYARLRESGVGKEASEWRKVIQSRKYENYCFIRMQLEDRAGMEQLFGEEKFDQVVNLAAQAGVRYSLTNPYAYIESNIAGFMNVLECCRHNNIKHLVYASSSSVYGLNEKMPFSESDSVDHPVSLYAATKKANELMAHTYSYLYGLPTTGLRFFTVYGPWGRPDMALFIFTRSILEGKPIDVYNNGEMKRDFTYIDDIVEAIVRVMNHVPKGDPSWSGAEPNPASSKAPFKIYNIGHSSPVKLMDFIHEIEKNLGKRAILNMLPLQAGDVTETWADVSALSSVVGYMPRVEIEEGIAKFIEWYKLFIYLR
jgi:UDP-glucuronate 4-epimerase